MKRLQIIILIFIIIFAVTGFTATKTQDKSSKSISSINSNQGIVTSIDDVITISASNVLLSGSIKIAPLKINDMIKSLKNIEIINASPGYYLANLIPFGSNVMKEDLPNILFLNSSVSGCIPIKNADIQIEEKSLSTLMFLNDNRDGIIDLVNKDITTESKSVNSILVLNLDKFYESSMKYVDILTPTLKATQSTKKSK